MRALALYVTALQMCAHKIGSTLETFHPHGKGLSSSPGNGLEMNIGSKPLYFASGSGTKCIDPLHIVITA
jgi:hypothetical protein